MNPPGIHATNYLTKGCLHYNPGFRAANPGYGSTNSSHVSRKNLLPIEKFWANLKAKIRKIISGFSTLAEAVDEAFKNDQLNFN